MVTCRDLSVDGVASCLVGVVVAACVDEDDGIGDWVAKPRRVELRTVGFRDSYRPCTSSVNTLV